MAYVIKRYSNRKLYDTQESRYVTLEEIEEMIRGGREISVADASSGEDLTSVTLTLQPALSVVFAVILLNEAPSSLQLAGVAVIIAGVVLATAGRHRQPYTEAEELRDVAQPG